MSSNTRNVVLAAGNVGLGFASSNITRRLHNISSVELPEVEHMYSVREGASLGALSKRRY